jgi:glutamyl-tRNA synthetase
MAERKVRVRFAPSPTGGLHMGGVRTALFNYLFAKKNGGDFILRIEDTDQTRFVPGAEDYIIQSLKWCGIEPNEGVGFGDGPHAPYKQSKRKEAGIYKKYAEQLITSGHAYYAFDTSSELDEMRKRLEAAKVVSPQYNATTRSSMRNSTTLSEDEVTKLLADNTPYVIRLKVPRNEEIRFHDVIRGWVVVNSSQVDDKVLLKSDGMPTYHLAHIVDDYLMEISHAVRGEEWLPSAPSHILIYRYLGWEEQMPKLVHLPLILKTDGHGKLSKRDKSGLPMFPLNWHDVNTDEKYEGYRERGFFPEAFINMLALLGWNAGNNQELFSMTELIDSFSFERVNKAGAKFDPLKTEWFNQQYLKLKPDTELMQALRQSPDAAHFAKVDDTFLTEFVRLMKEKIHFVSEFYKLGSYFFESPKMYDEEVLKKRLNEKTLAYLKYLRMAFENLNPFQALEIENTFKSVAEQNGLKTGEVMQLLRVALTGVSGGPGIFEMTTLFGKTETLSRLDTFLKDRVLA